jgi:hypothetical protein
MDTRQGTCGNMAMVPVALAWRLGWPVFLACAGYHFLARFDDGQVQYNLEATNTGNGGFSSSPDEYYSQKYSTTMSGLPIQVDLKPLRGRELLGVFVGNRARHYWDLGMINEAGAHYHFGLPHEKWTRS